METDTLPQAAVVPVADEHAGTNGTAAELDVEVKDTVPEPEVEGAAKVYFVRIPRPPTDETAREQLQKTFQAHLADLKNINARVNAKRDIVKGLRGQMHEAMSLKGSAQPEFEDKLNQLRQLRNLRQSYLADITSIKNKVKGLDCKTEQELDAKIKGEEDRIRLGSVTLREEKMIVNDISKLRTQREKIKEYELERSRLGELESSVTKVKAAIEDMEAEFSVIKGEFDAASKVTTGFYDQVKAAEKEVSKVEEDQKEAAERKNEAHEALEVAKREVDASMFDYRENRKFSLQIRDLVANAEVEAAQELCAAQMDQMISKWLTDASFRSDYNKILAEQRRFSVSDLLPASSTAAAAAAAPSGKASGRGAAAPAVKLVPRGKEKAEELIASIMSSASVEAAYRRLHAPRDADDADEVEEPEVVEAKPAAPAKPVVPSKPAAAPKLVANPAAKAAEVFNYKVEVPKVEDVEFVVPIVKTETEAISKDQVREEQRAKAQEAELRKKKRQETAGKKKAKAIELQKKADDDERSTKKAVVESKAVESAPKEEEEEEEVVTITERTVAASASKPAAATAVAPRMGPAAKRPASKSGFLRKLKKFYQANQALMVVAAVIALIVFILIAASFY